jgi:flagellin-like hook-associated protein FlgL
MASGITINSNLAALSAQRRLGQSTQSVQQSFTRLSSGLRINRASDDSAGLAIAGSLDIDAHVYAQGVRNLNDAIGLLNIAEGAAKELTTILIRQRELATQSANGTFTRSQRQALHEEANALVTEYNRIVDSVEFNGQRLLNLSVGRLRIQAGYGENGALNIALGEDLARTVGDGSFTSSGSYTLPAGGQRNITTADFNGDGKVDIATCTQTGTSAIAVFLGNGNGSFATGHTYESIGIFDVKAGDLNGDGIPDLAAVHDWNVEVFIGRGDGTFADGVDYSQNDFGHLRITDLNGDGALDLLGHGGNSVAVMLGNGNGTFRAETSFVNDQPAFGGGMAIGDINGDGLTDVVAANYVVTEMALFYGTANGRFTYRGTVEGGGSGGSRMVDLSDLNADGALDMVYTLDVCEGVEVKLGNGDGSFGSALWYATSEKSDYIKLDDLNGDGFVDAAVSTWATNAVDILLGNGNGTFRASATFAAGTTTCNLELADINADGALDIAAIATGSDTLEILLANSRNITTIAPLNLNSRQSALESMDTIDQALERVSSELGSIGAMQSRLATATSNLQQSRENILAARSQIIDADVAQEAAQLVRNQILQQAAAAVLAQANSQPALALRLLNGG